MQGLNVANAMSTTLVLAFVFYRHNLPHIGSLCDLGLRLGTVGFARGSHRTRFAIQYAAGAQVAAGMSQSWIATSFSKHLLIPLCQKPLPGTLFSVGFLSLRLVPSDHRHERKIRASEA